MRPSWPIARPFFWTPIIPEIHSNLGNALARKRQLEDAVIAYRRAIALKPGYAEAYSNLGLALRAGEQFDEAIETYRRALHFDPNLVEAQMNLGSALREVGQVSESISAFRTAVALKPDSPEAGSDLVFTLLFDPACDAQSLAQEHRDWNRRNALPLKQFIEPHHNNRDQDRRLGVGYVSPDFRVHAVSRFLLQLLAAHDHGQLDVF